MHVGAADRQGAENLSNIARVIDINVSICEIIISWPDIIRNRYLFWSVSGYARRSVVPLAHAARLNEIDVADPCDGYDFSTTEFRKSSDCSDLFTDNTTSMKTL